MNDILDDLIDLHKQATTEQSHYYVANCCKRSISEIVLLRAALADIENMEGAEDITDRRFAKKALAIVKRALVRRHG